MRAALGPRLCTALGRREVPGCARAAVHAGRGTGSPPARRAPSCRTGVGPLRVVTPGLVRLAQRRGLQVHVWTVDDAAEMHRLLDLGVDGLMTDELRHAA